MRRSGRWVGCGLTLGIALAVVLPEAASATSLASAINTPSNGTTFIATGNTIQLEVTVAPTELLFDTVFWAITVDATAALGSGSGWAGAANADTDWDWRWSAPKAPKLTWAPVPPPPVRSGWDLIPSL